VYVFQKNIFLKENVQKHFAADCILTNILNFFRLLYFIQFVK